MPDKLHPPHAPVRDEDLLANAIPIEDDEDDEQTTPAKDELAPIDFDNGPTGDDHGASKIRTFGSHAHTERQWKRQPVKTGDGAVRVKTFVAKLRLDAIEHLDEQINEWLDEHPEYEVKFTSSAVVPLIGKLTEEAIFISVWV